MRLIRPERMVLASSIVALAICFSGCGYALAGKGNTLPEYIRRIGVPTFQNLSTTPELDRLITEAVRIQLQSRGKFVVVTDTTGVDAVLTGSIRSVTLAPAAFTADTRQASKYTITVTASAEFKETKAGVKPHYSNPSLRFTDEYEVASGLAVNDLAALFTQDRSALDRIAKKFAEALVSAILEAF